MVLLSLSNFHYCHLLPVPRSSQQSCEEHFWKPFYPLGDCTEIQWDAFPILSSFTNGGMLVSKWTYLLLINLISKIKKLKKVDKEATTYSSFCGQHFSFNDDNVIWLWIKETELEVVKTNTVSPALHLRTVCKNKCQGRMTDTWLNQNKYSVVVEWGVVIRTAARAQTQETLSLHSWVAGAWSPRSLKPVFFKVCFFPPYGLAPVLH